MKNEQIRLVKENRQTELLQQSFSLTKSLLANPLLIGFSLAMVNHAVYKTGWYESDVSIPAGGMFSGIFGFLGGSVSPQEAAANVHDSVFMMIAAATVIASLKQGASLSEIPSLK